MDLVALASGSGIFRTEILSAGDYPGYGMYYVGDRSVGRKVIGFIQSPIGGSLLYIYSMDRQVSVRY